MLEEAHNEKFKYFFTPKSVAVVGASIKKGSVGRAIMENLVEKFRGAIYPVNPKYEEVLGVRCYGSCLDLPEPPELVVIAVPARSVPQVIKDCGDKGSKAVLVISAGFKETGSEGAELEKAVVKIARSYGMRLIGPNCLGIYDPYSGLDTIFNPSDRQMKPVPGSVSFISQSGALGAAVLDWFAEAGIGLSKFVSYGNAADVKEWELIEYLAHDPKTKVISVYVEGVEDGKAFVNSIREAVLKGKPVVVLKAGKSLRGIKAVASHTGSLAGSYHVYESAIKQFGGLIVNELSELVTAVKALSWLPPPKGRKVGIVTNGGGAGVLATDAAELNGMEIADLSTDTRQFLQENLPPAASVNNPVDVLGDAPPERYEISIKALLKDEKVDALVVIGIMQSPAFDPVGFLNVLKNFRGGLGKPIVIAAPGGDYTEKNLLMFEREARVPSFKTPEDAVKALTYLVKWSEIRKRFKENAPR